MKLNSIVSFFKNKNKGITHEENTSYDEASLLRDKIERRKKKQKRITRIVASLSILAFIFLCFGIYSQYQLHRLEQEESLGTVTSINGEKVVKKVPQTGEEIVAALKTHVKVPEGDPQIAVVQDVSKLKQTQAFFKDAQNGDVIVVYDSLIYLYRPTLDIVIGFGDISGIEETNP
jgi:hypothetical protein